MTFCRSPKLLGTILLGFIGQWDVILKINVSDALIVKDEVATSLDKLSAFAASGPMIVFQDNEAGDLDVPNVLSPKM